VRASLLARAAPRPLTGVAGALALATEPPREQLMLRKPYGRTEAIINNVMWRNLLAMAAFQLIVLFTLYYRGCDLLHFGTSQQIHSASLCANYPSVPYLAPGAANGTVTCYDRLHGCPPLKDVNGAKFSSDDRLKFSDYNTLTTTIFNAFVFMQFFNEMNARNMEEANVFRGLFGALPPAVLLAAASALTRAPQATTCSWASSSSPRAPSSALSSLRAPSRRPWRSTGSTG